jgi:hypothetical protein
MVAIRVLRNEVVVGDAALQPTYHGEEINGSGCGLCPMAVEHVEVP